MPVPKIARRLILGTGTLVRPQLSRPLVKKTLCNGNLRSFAKALSSRPDADFGNQSESQFGNCLDRSAISELRSLNNRLVKTLQQRRKVGAF